MKQINSNGHIFGGAADLKSVENFLNGTESSYGVRQYLTADYVARMAEGGNTLVSGWDSVFPYRIFVESPSFKTNSTGKWTLVMYGDSLSEIKRQVVGGANRVGSWAKVAELALEWIEDILLPLKTKLEMDIMFDAAYDVESEISADASAIAECIENIDDYLNADADDVDDETRLDWIATEIKDMEMYLQYIKNSLDSCLDKCSDITHCEIGWDDFCGCDYFEDLRADWTPSTLWTDLDVEDEMDYILSHIFRGADVDDDFLFEIMDRTGYVIAA